ncbi:MAG: sensor histidine kinase [Actinomycetota bacterium]
MSRPRRAVGLSPRLFLAQGLVIVAGAVTLLVVALLLAPGLFAEHLTRSGVPISGEVRQHLDEAFAGATLTSLAVAVSAALVTALAASWFVARRVVRPLRTMADAAERIAGGDYSARVGGQGAGAELDSLARALDRMARELAATERTRAEMLRDVAHELRTPLTTMRGHVEALADGVLTADGETLQTMQEGLSRMQRLVDDLATVSRAEERRLDLTLSPADPAELVAAAVGAAARSFAAAGVELRSHAERGLPCVAVDADRIHQVLANLLDNAVRHTPAGGVVTVTARSGPGGVELEVQDTGVGIAAEHLPRVFERFYRVDAGRTRQQGGSGIGLAIARALTEVHGGSIRADSPGPGGGSSFTVTLPATAPAPPRASRGRPGPRRPTP